MTINLENYVIDEDSNGDLVIQDPGGATVLTWDDSASNWLLGDSVDAQGNDLNSVGSIDAENLNSTIYVDPNGTLQNDVDAVPAGGRLVFEPGQTYDVATIGTAVIDHPITVEWQGGGEQGNTPQDPVLINSGGDAVAGPIIQLGSGSTFDTRPIAGVMKRPTILHEGSGPAIECNNATGWTINTPMIDCNGVGEKCIEYTGEKALTQIRGGVLRRATAWAVDDNGSGGLCGYWGVNLNAGTGSTGATGGNFNTGSGTHVAVACQFGGSMNPVGIEVEGSENRFYGCLFEGPDISVRFNAPSGSAADCTGNLVDGARFVSVDDVCVEFDNARGNEVVRPRRMINGATSGNAARWTSNSIRNAVKGSFWELKDMSWNLGGTQPVVKFDPEPNLSDAGRGLINQPVSGMSIHNTDDGLPNYYNGADWVLPDGTTT